MILAGVAAPELQVEIPRPGNAGYYLADYGWQMPDGSWTLAELHGLGKFEDEAQNDPEQAAAKTYRAALMRDANLRHGPQRHSFQTLGHLRSRIVRCHDARLRYSDNKTLRRLPIEKSFAANLQ